MSSAHAGIVAAFALVMFGSGSVAETPTGPPQAMSKLAAATSLAPMLERVLPGVVSILVEGQRDRPVTINAEGSAIDAPMKEPFRAGGSGVVIDADKGLIVTNHHVIVDATSISVLTLDGRIAEARLLGTDAATDVAILQVSLKNLTVVPYGDSDQLRVGDFIVAVGAPYGLEGSASQGIVSALMRTDIGYEIFEDFIQIDAAVNPGNSGGALVDIDGRLVGINTASGSQKLRAQGISFAIPINMARAIAEELLAKGKFQRGSLGIVTEDLNFTMASEMGLSITRGAAVKEVLAGSPAERAGIKKGDVIVAIAGKPVRGHVDYASRVATTPIGTPTGLTVVTGPSSKREVVVDVADFAIPPVAETGTMSANALQGVQLGMLMPGFRAFGAVQGARVLSLSDRATKFGLRLDDVIVKVDTTTVRAPRDVFDAVTAKMDRYRLEIDRDGKRYWIWVQG